MKKKKQRGKILRENPNQKIKTSAILKAASAMGRFYTATPLMRRIMSKDSVD